MRRFPSLFLSLVAVSLLYFNSTADGGSPPPSLPTSTTPTTISIAVNAPDYANLTKTLTTLPPQWFAADALHGKGNVWIVRESSSEAEWDEWVIRYELPLETSHWKLVGETMPGIHTILLRGGSASVCGVLLHECGHVFLMEEVSKTQDASLQVEWIQEVLDRSVVSEYGKTNWQECFCESLRVYYGGDKKKVPAGMAGVITATGG